MRRKLSNYFYKFMADFHKDMRDFFNKDNVFICNPIKSSFHHMRMQKWENKIKTKNK